MEKVFVSIPINMRLYSITKTTLYFINGIVDSFLDEHNITTDDITIFPQPEDDTLSDYSILKQEMRLIQESDIVIFILMPHVSLQKWKLLYSLCKSNNKTTYVISENTLKRYEKDY